MKNRIHFRLALCIALKAFWTIFRGVWGMQAVAYNNITYTIHVNPRDPNDRFWDCHT